MIPYLIYSFGSVLCVLNFYVSTLRKPLIRYAATENSTLRSVSRVPVLGTLFVLVGWSKLGGSPLLNATSLILILIDTGGPHWYFAASICASIRRGWNHEAL